MSNGRLQRRYPLAIALSLLAIAIIGLLVVFWFRSSTVVIVIRHAERNDAALCSPATIYGSANRPLSLVNGQSPRAQALVHVCGESGIEAIYASEFCRTQETVEPLAAHLGLTVNVVDQFASGGVLQIADLVNRVLTDHRGETVLIAGHSNSVPAIVEGLSGISVSPIPESEFDNMFVIYIPRWFSNHRVVRLKYGDPSL